jgi:predicted N-acyltransferase
MSESPYTIQEAASIHCFSVEQWNSVVPRDEPQLRHEVLAAVEKSDLGCPPRYLAVRDAAGNIAGVGVTYDVDIDLLTLASSKLQKTAQAIRRGPLRRFLIIRSVTSGPVMTNCRPNIWLAGNLNPAQRKAAARILVEALDKLDGASLRLLFEHPSETVEQFGSALLDHGYTQGASLPGTRLEIRWDNFEAYLAEMRKFYRRAVRFDQKLAAGLEIEVLHDFAHLADEAHALYANVVEKADSVFLKLTPDFFASFATCEQSRLVTAREKSTGKLVGIELLLVGDHVIQDLYTGVDYEANEKYNVYFNLVYPGIEMACREGKTCISTGQTSYEFKSRLGVKSHPLALFVKHRNPLANWAVRSCIGLLCPTVEVPVHRVFHSDVIPEEELLRPAPPEPTPRQLLSPAAIPAPKEVPHPSLSPTV